MPFLPTFQLRKARVGSPLGAGASSHVGETVGQRSRGRARGEDERPDKEGAARECMDMAILSRSSCYLPRPHGKRNTCWQAAALTVDGEDGWMGGFGFRRCSFICSSSSPWFQNISIPAASRTACICRLIESRLWCARSSVSSLLLLRPAADG